jgi:glycosyltransferase involved in cell wall biosynthesis
MTVRRSEQGDDRPLRVETGPARPAVEIVIPVHNEQRVLAASVRKLHAHMRRELGFSFQITIANNASTDDTSSRAEALARELPGVVALDLELEGRGRALRAAWGRSEADVLA